MSFDQITLWISASVLHLLIFFRAVHEKTLRHYKAFYTYVAFVSAVSLARIFICWKYGYYSRQYYYGYHITNFPMPVFQLLVLLDLYGQFIGYSKISWKRVGKFVTVAVVIAAPLAWKVFRTPNVSPFLGYDVFTLLLQVPACLVVCRAYGARRDVDFGRNLKGIFMGIALMVALQTINFANLVLAGSSYSVFSFLAQFIYFLALAIFAYTLWNFDPVRVLEPVDMQLFDKVNQDVQQAVKTFLSSR